MLFVSTRIPRAVEQMLLPENWLKDVFLKNYHTEGHLGRTPRLAAAGIELVTFSFFYGLQKHWANLTALNVPWLGWLAW